jgi:hypothetical protein
VLTGRQEPLDRLAEALRAAMHGEAVTAFVHGESGMGKTALARAFLGRVPADALVLEGRCYDRESAPFEAVDGWIEALRQHLDRLPTERLDRLLPQHMFALGRLFPDLRAFQRGDGREAVIPDVEELRRRAFGALRQLLDRLAAEQPVVLFVDDLQWADADLTALLAELVRPPQPPVLVLGCYRSEELARAAALRGLLAAAVPHRQIALAALPSTAAVELALAKLGADDPASREVAASIAREARGSPLVIEQLAEHVRSGARFDEDVTFEALIEARLARLPAPARALLSAIAVAGQPVSQAVAFSAASLDAPGSALEALRAARLVRVHGALPGGTVEAHHDRIREVMVARLDAGERAGWHRALVHALEAAGGADPEALATHYREAGEVTRAAAHTAVAALRAATAMAFDRAARLYRVAIELSADAGPATLRLLHIGLGDALAAAGRGGEASEALLAAARGAEPVEALELERRAADQLMRSGHFTEALALLGDLLAKLGWRLQPTPRRAVLSFLAGRARIKLRGLDFVERPATALPRELLTRIDTGWTLATGLGMIDTIRGADLQNRHLLLALDAGEPYRVTRALILEAAYTSTAGLGAQDRAVAVERRARALAERIGNPHAIGFAALCRALIAFEMGRWRDCVNACDESDATLTERCTNVWWERATLQVFRAAALFYLGEATEMRARVTAFQREADAHDDRYAMSQARLSDLNLAWLIADDLDGARREADRAIALFAARGFPTQPYYVLGAQASADLYAGDGAGAWRRVVAEWPALEASLFLRVQIIRILAHWLKARAALAAARADARLWRAAQREAARLEREHSPVGDAFARLVRAGVAHGLGDDPACARLLDEAAVAFTAVEMPLHAACARARAGQRAEAEATLRARGVRAPARMIALLAPGF